MLDAIGWVATAVFSCSYCCRRARDLKWIQAGAAVIWVAYGSIIHAMPVVAANLIVALAAVGSSIYKPSVRRGS
jgi:hypothetical protein